MNPTQLLAHFDKINDAPDSIPRLRRFILDLAVRGKLVPQDPKDQPAMELLKRIATEKARLVKVGDIRKEKPLPDFRPDEAPFDIPPGWRWVRIRKVTGDRGQTVPDKDFTYIDVTAIDKEVGRIADARVLSAAEAPSRARKIVRNGDVLYSCVRPYLLNIAVVETEISPPPIASTAFAILNGFGLVLAQYQWIVLRSPFFVACVEEKMRGQAYPAINDSDFALLPFPLPPLSEQHRIIARVDELMALCDRLEAARAERESRRDRLAKSSLARLNTPDLESFHDDARFALDVLPTLTTRPDQIKQLRETVLNLAVRGKLVAQDPNDEPAKVTVERLSGAPPRVLLEADQPELARALPSGWYATTVGTCFDVTGGIQKTPARMPRGNAYPYLSVGNVYRGSLNLTEVKRFELQLGELERYRLVAGDILVVEGNGSASEIGRCAVWRDAIENCVHQNHIIRCRPRDPVLTAFTALYLNSPDGMEIMRKLAITSAGLFSLSVGKIKRIGIILPPIAEQYRIVTKVDELMVLCDRLENSLRKGEERRSSLLTAILGDALRPIDERDEAA